ncbi:Plastid division protein PDV2 [Abeliophyllum distichum]|uniref:Plastid division protein PDV2 n=1 Tax=Abeliophyllum distichum TaxID=126358 RepID=A0ABD1P8H9_9LAMI
MLAGTAAKAALTIIGVISILSLAGFEPSVRKRGNHFKFLDIFQLQQNNDKGTAVAECPTGKIPVMENGEMRCVVKERVEIPFESGVSDTGCELWVWMKLYLSLSFVYTALVFDIMQKRNNLGRAFILFGY